MAKDVTEWEHMTKRGGFLDAKLGKGWSAPFTGYTWKAFRAYVGLVAAWYSADSSSRIDIESAMCLVLGTMQSSEMLAARMAIYGCGFESAMWELWAKIDPNANHKEST